MIQGSCLCGAVKFEFEMIESAFRLCHCHRCQKFTGSAFFAGFNVSGLRFRSGEKLVRFYEAPVLVTPPPYRKDFCERCGSPVPWPGHEEGLYGVPAGSLDEDPGIRPAEHVWTECNAPWHEITDGLPRFTEAQFVYRAVKEWEEAGNDTREGYEFILKHYPGSDVADAAKQRLAKLKGDA